MRRCNDCKCNRYESISWLRIQDKGTPNDHANVCVPRYAFVNGGEKRMKVLLFAWSGSSWNRESGYLFIFVGWFSCSYKHKLVRTFLCGFTSVIIRLRSFMQNENVVLFLQEATRDCLTFFNNVRNLKMICRCSSLSTASNNSWSFLSRVQEIHSIVIIRLRMFKEFLISVEKF